MPGAGKPAPGRLYHRSATVVAFYRSQVRQVPLIQALNDVEAPSQETRSLVVTLFDPVSG